MDLQDIEVGSSFPRSCDNVYCRCEKASSESEAGTHHLSV
jgi:hypothetical protein